MNSAEQLQQYLDAQTEIIEEHREDIKEYEEQLNAYSEKLEEVSANLIFYQDYISFVRFFDQEKYSECISMAVSLSTNAAFISTISEDGNQTAITDEAIIAFYEIIDEILENEEILQQITAEQIDELKIIQNKG